MVNVFNRTSYNFTRGFLCGCGLFCGMAFVALLIGLTCYKLSFINEFLLFSPKLTPLETKHIEALLATNRIIPAADVVSHVATFYSTVITILVGIIGLVAIIGFFHLKHLTIEKLAEHKNKVTTEAKEEAAKDVQIYLNSKDFLDVISKHVDESLEGTKVDEINKKIADLENAIEELQNVGGTSIPREVSSSIEIIGGNRNGNN